MGSWLTQGLSQFRGSGKGLIHQVDFLLLFGSPSPLSFIPLTLLHQDFVSLLVSSCSTSCVIPSFSSAFIAINELVSTVSLLEQDNIPNICSNTKLPNKMVSPYNFGSVLESLVTCFVPAGPLILFGSVW